MGALAHMWRRLAGALAKSDRHELEDRLDDEIRFHVEQQIEKNRRAGMAPDEARRQALIRFGGVEQMREGTRDEFRAARIEHLARDVRYGLRSLRRHPGFTAMAVLSLAIGIGANAAIFGVVHAVLFRDSPLAQPETLVNIYETEGGRGFNPLSHPNIEDLRKGTTEVFSGIAASTFACAPIDRDGTATIVMGEAVTGGAFALLGVEPLLGRAILPEDDVARGGHPVVMLSHGYWQRAFGADPQVVGRTLRMGGRSYTIIGVAPADYRGGLPALTPAFYVPMAMAERADGRRHARPARLPQLLRQGAARTGRDASAGRARRLPRGGRLSPRARPEGWVPGEQFSLVPTSDVQVYPGVDPLLRAAAWLLMAVVGLVLLLACTNLASFLLARALDRGKEVAVRRALGATRGALVRQLLVESALLGLAGAAVGLVLALGLLRALVSIDLPLPYRHEARSSLRHRLEGAVRLASPGVHSGRRRGGRGPPRTGPCRAGNTRRSRLGTQDGQQRERRAGPSQVAQRAGRRSNRHVARAARGRRAVPEELAADAGRRSGLRPGSDVDPVPLDAGRAFDSRRGRAADAWRARALSGAARRRSRRARLAAAARVRRQLHRLHDRRTRSAPGPGGVPRRARHRGRRVLRRGRHGDRGWPHLQRRRPARHVNPWPSSARPWPVATGQTGTRWAASSAGPIRPSPT